MSLCTDCIGSEMTTCAMQSKWSDFVDRAAASWAKMLDALAKALDG